MSTGAPCKIYKKEHIIQAKRAMLSELASISGGQLIRGCCTQDCCDGDGDLGRFRAVMPDLNAPRYTKSDLIQAKRAMLSELASIAGGRLIAGCCTQGCCDDDAIAALINVP